MRSVLEAREELRRSNERMSAVLESITDGFAVVDSEWTITYLNARAEEIIRPHKRTREDLVGKNLWEEFPELCGTVLEAQFRHAMESQHSVGFELYYLPRQRWLEVRAYPSTEGLTAYVQDIHQRKVDERTLRESANRLQVALAAGKLGDWEWDAATDRVKLGRRAAEIFELPAEIPITWPVLRERVLPEDFEFVRRAFLDAYMQRSDFNIECRIVRRTGERVWLSVVGHGNYSDQRVLLGMTGMVQDISTRKAAEDTLRTSEEELRALANSIPQLAWIANFDGGMIWYNERWYQYTGTTPGLVLGDGWQQVYDPDCLPSMMEHWAASVRSGQPFEMEFPIRGADGQFRWFLTRANPVRDASGHLLRWFGTSTDVDQVKRAQEALRDESAILELLNNTGNAIARQRDLRPLLQEVTDAATRISGARWGAFYYNSAGHTFHTLSGLPPGLFADLPRPSGEDILRNDDLPGYPPVRSYLAVPVYSRAGEVIGNLSFGHPEAAMFSERTERIVAGIAAQAGVAIDNARLYEAAQQSAEERKLLLDSERSARAEAERTSQMKDEFLATLSHELRTPLTAILGWAQVLRRGSRGQDDLNRGLETIERNARSQAQLIEDLLDMSRITSGKVLLDMKQLAPSTVVDAAIETVRPAADAKGIRIERSYRPAGHVAGDASRLQQVVWNLLSNALKFTPKGGTVRVSIREESGQAADGHVELTIADTGIGIRPEFLAHVFERFRQADASTTRRHGGLGLGLSIVKHLVEQHGGTVSASSEGEGQGASFTVRLPLASGVVRSRPSHARQRHNSASLPEMGLRDLKGLRVLVVDDEADARELVRRILSDCNAQVLTAANADEALALARDGELDLLVSDIGMPDVDGFQLLSKVRALGPKRGGSVPAIALTAFARTEDRLRALESGFLDHVPKPVEPSELIATVARVASVGLS
jgi:PAS domain S-box-containing protein